MEAYEGREPYIFISYARKDNDRVTPFLEALSNAGYRVWWDKGIEAGADWLKKLFAKVEGCAVFCPLFSEAFQNSRYCFIETAWAYHNEKNIVPLYLEELKEDSFRGLYRLLRKLQYLPLYQYADAAQFVKQRESQQAFALCKKPEWHKTGEIQWRLSVDGVLMIAKNSIKNKNLQFYYSRGSFPHYQYDPSNEGSTAPWSPYREKILFVEISDDIDAIGDFAFYDCESLTEVRIPDSVTQIGDSAFAYCESLTKVRIPDSVTQIGAFAFAYCESLTKVRIPDKVTQIGNRTFESCENLTEVHIPDSVTAIGERAFVGCKNLTGVEMSARTEVGEYAFFRHTRVIRRAAPEQ